MYLNMSSCSNPRRYATNLRLNHSTHTERLRILTSVRTAAQKRLSLRGRLGCVFVHGRKSRVRNGKAHRRIRNGGTVAWLSQPVSGQVQAADVRITDLHLRNNMTRNQNDTLDEVNILLGIPLLSEYIPQTYIPVPLIIKILVHFTQEKKNSFLNFSIQYRSIGFRTCPAFPHGLQSVISTLWSHFS